jgi:hypothetical protein
MCPLASFCGLIEIPVEQKDFAELNHRIDAGEILTWKTHESSLAPSFTPGLSTRFDRIVLLLALCTSRGSSIGVNYTGHVHRGQDHVGPNERLNR